jgi:hypothetical protein
MVSHIYGRINLLNALPRANLFINELRMYVDYLKNELLKNKNDITARNKKYIDDFRSNLIEGIEYYKKLAVGFNTKYEILFHSFTEELSAVLNKISAEPALA